MEKSTQTCNEPATNAHEPRLYTIGHSNHSWETFAALLRQHEVEVLIDVRTTPLSAYTPQFNTDTLRGGIEAAGMRYGHYGRELGGRPADASLYDRNGRVCYNLVAQTELFQDGLARLRRGLDTKRVAILCSEEDPNICHRRLLVTRVLNAQGVAALHIRGDGRIEEERQADWDRRQRERAAAQTLSLFDALGEEDAEDDFTKDEANDDWKSIASVLQKRPQPNFSGD